MCCTSVGAMWPVGPIHSHTKIKFIERHVGYVTAMK